MARKLSDAIEQSNVDPTIIQKCLAEYENVAREINRLAQQQAAMFHRYEGQGVNVKSIKAAHRAAKLGKQAARAQAQSDMRYMIVCGVLHPADDDWVRTVSQSSLFAEEENPDSIGTASPDLARARAHTDGYNSGRHGGLPINNPFQAGTLEHVAWEEGRRDGTDDKALRAAGAKVANVTPPATRKRGRPAGSGKRGSNGASAHV